MPQASYGKFLFAVFLPYNINQYVYYIMCEPSRGGEPVMVGNYRCVCVRWVSESYMCVCVCVRFYVWTYSCGEHTCYFWLKAWNGWTHTHTSGGWKKSAAVRSTLYTDLRIRDRVLSISIQLMQVASHMLRSRVSAYVYIDSIQVIIEQAHRLCIPYQCRNDLHLCAD